MSNQNSDDELIQALDEFIRPLTKKIEKTDDHGIFVIGVRYFNQGAGERISAYTATAGDLGVLAEGLYASISDSLKSGNSMLYDVLQAVVKDIEEDFDLGSSDELKSDISFH